MKNLLGSNVILRFGGQDEHMNKIRLIEKGTDISRLEMIAMPWDVEINNIPYQVVIIKGYVHSIGGRRGENDLWMHPRGSKPTYENLVEYQCDGMGVCWGIEYKPCNYIKSKWDESECFTSGGAMITRNGKDFYFCMSGIDEATEFNDLLVNKSLNDWWWTCTQWTTKERGWERSIAVVSPSGNFNYCSYYDGRGVRPFCILKSNVFIEKGE